MKNGKLPFLNYAVHVEDDGGPLFFWIHTQCNTNCLSWVSETIFINTVKKKGTHQEYTSHLQISRPSLCLYSQYTYLWKIQWHQTEKEKKNRCKTIVISYVTGVSETPQRILSKYILVLYQTHNNTVHLHLKDKGHSFEGNNVHSLDRVDG